MGCNYYAIRKVDNELKAQIVEAINADDFQLAKALIPKEIHIGKSSGGWVFIFNHHNWQHFERSLESLKEFLGACEIYDEYSRQIPNDEFWQMVESKKSSKLDLQYGTMEFGLNFSDSTEFS